MTGFCKCLCKLVGFPSVFKLLFYFKTIVISRNNTECLIGMVFGKKEKSELERVDNTQRNYTEY